MFIILNPAIAAVSDLKTKLPNLIGIKPLLIAKFSSSGTKPPSGPINIFISFSLVAV